MVACLSRGEEKQHLLPSLGWVIEKKLIFIKVRESGDMAKSPIGDYITEPLVWRGAG